MEKTISIPTKRMPRARLNVEPASINNGEISTQGKSNKAKQSVDGPPCL